MRPIIIGFGLLILCLLILFQIGEVNFIKGNVRLEVIVAIVAFIFFFVGLYFNYQAQKKTATEKTSSSQFISENKIDYEQLKKTGLTQREHEVLFTIISSLSLMRKQKESVA